MTAPGDNRSAKPAEREQAHAVAATRPHTAGFPWFRLVVFSIVAMCLVWTVITHSFSAYLAGVDPEAALRLESGNPKALLSLATSELRLLQPSRSGKESQPSKDATRSVADIRRRTERALMSDPLNARAFGVLGRVSNEDAEAKTFMEAAVDRSLHERNAAYWMMTKSYEEQALQEALRYADTLLRSQPQAMPHVVPILGKIAESDEGRDALNEVLASNPPWRPAFFSHLPNAITDARTPLDLLFALNDTSAPATTADIRSYVSFLIDHKFFDLAYYVWLQFLPATQLSNTGHLFNGAFETPSSGLPFDWAFGESPGTIVKIAQPRPDAPKNRAMFLEFGPGRVKFQGVRQMVLLAPGRYQFRGWKKMDIVSQRGLRWGIRCVDGKVIGKSALVKGVKPEWLAFEFSFTVPPEDCPAQYVQLKLDARSASERFISGTVWYDDLEIEREAGARSGAGGSEGG